MTTDEMRKELLNTCKKTDCAKCELRNETFCRSIIACGTSKKIRRIFHDRFPTYFSKQNRSNDDLRIYIKVCENKVQAKAVYRNGTIYKDGSGEIGTKYYTAKCSPEDEFKLLTGIKLAVKRLIEGEGLDG